MKLATSTLTLTLLIISSTPVLYLIASGKASSPGGELYLILLYLATLEVIFRISNSNQDNLINLYNLVILQAKYYIYINKKKAMTSLTIGLPTRPETRTVLKIYAL